jgi:hypothetical protein
MEEECSPVSWRNPSKPRAKTLEVRRVFDPGICTGTLIGNRFVEIHE